MYKCFSSIVRIVFRTMYRYVLSVLLPFGATIFRTLGRCVLNLLITEVHRCLSMYVNLYSRALGNLQQAPEEPVIRHIMRR